MLQEHKLYLKPEKCEFEWTWIEYLGLVISEGQAKMDPMKVKGVKVYWPILKNMQPLPQNEDPMLTTDG